MNESHADALVIFGATGDLAFKKIFPALYDMTREGRLDVPVVTVAREGLECGQDSRTRAGQHRGLCRQRR